MQRREGRPGFILTDADGLAARAALYVSGKMTAADREHAERDLLEVPAFRDAVLQAAQQAGRLPDPATLHGDRDWRDIAAGLARLPQLRGKQERSGPPGPAPTSGRGAAGGGRAHGSPFATANIAAVGLALIVGGVAGLAAGPYLRSEPRTLSVAVLVDEAGVATATVESRSDASLRVLLTLTPGLPLTLLRIEDGDTTGVRIGTLAMQGEVVFPSAGIGASAADYQLVREKADGGAGATVASGSVRGIVRD